MPELPEVEVARRRITSLLAGKVIERVTVRNCRLRRPVPENLQTELPGQTLVSVERRGKYLLFRCSEGCIILHLGMTGNLYVVPTAAPPLKHDHVDLVFTDGLSLRFNDPRRFGAVDWTEENPLSHRLLDKLGPEPLTAVFSGNYLYQRSRRRRISVKQFIMDPTVVSGLGNIYASEALFVAGIHPGENAGQLSSAGSKRLAEAIREVLTAAIQEGMAQAVISSNRGRETVYFPVSLRVYGRSGEPCSRCGNVISRLMLGGRSTFFCPTCQR